MGRPRFAFFSTFACCLALAQAALAGIDFKGADLATVAVRPEYMLTGDLNNDHQSDIVVIAPQSDEVDVYLAGGPPSFFASVMSLHFGVKLGRGALGDLNGDGILDLAVTDTVGDSVWISLGVGDGTFLTAYQIAVPNSKRPTAVAIGNFDQMGYNDLAVSDDKLGRIFILRNNNSAAPRFLQGGQVDVGLAPEDIRAVDLDGDGNLDLLVLNIGGPRVKELDTVLWTGVTQGFPVFATPAKFTLGANPSSLVVADFDNNGLPDVAMLNRPAGTTATTELDEIDVLLNGVNGSPAGTFAPSETIELPCPFATAGRVCRGLSLAAADFDGNGFVDIVAALSDPRAGSLADAMQAFGGQGNGSFVGGGVFATQKAPLSMVAADITGDGAPDIAIANQQTLNLQVFVDVSTAGMNGNGQGCLLDDACLSNRCTDGVCCAAQCDVTNNEHCNVPGREGNCVAIPTAPAMCTLPNPTCATGAFCVDGFCCDESCQGGHCDLTGLLGVCVPGLPPGAFCNGEDHLCSVGFCSSGVCCNSPCVGGTCDQNGICSSLPNGNACSQNSDCTSNICDPTSSICCETQCDPSTPCFPGEGVCRPTDYTPMPTATATRTATPRLTPVATGECSFPTDCTTGNCVGGVCCQTGSCPDGQVCQLATGLCANAPPTPTPTPTLQPGVPTSTLQPGVPTSTRTVGGGPTPDPCGDPSICPGQQCKVVNGAPACISTSGGGGCSTVGDAPAPGNLAVAALLPLALWVGRRWQLRRVRVRGRAPRQ